MHALADNLTWHDLPATKSNPVRQWTWTPGGGSHTDNRDGTLAIRQRKSAGGKWDQDSYGVEEQDTDDHGREFLLVNDTDDEQEDVYKVFVAGAGEHRDSCTCRAVVCRQYSCKHTAALRDLTTTEEHQ